MLDPNTASQTNATVQMVSEINALLADHFALYVKTKNFHLVFSTPNILGKSFALQHTLMYIETWLAMTMTSR